MSKLGDIEMMALSDPEDQATVGRQLDELVDLSREVGRPERDLVVYMEGNTSALLGDGTFLIKASGAQLASVEAADFVRLRLSPLLEAVMAGPPRAADRLWASARVDVSSEGRAPSIETFVHVVCLGIAGARVVIHTHPTPIVGLLCAPAAEEILTERALFPEEVVVCGSAPLYVPYAEPGLALGSAVAKHLRDHMERHGEPPRTIYLANHGLFALGGSGVEALAITEMAAKAARIRVTALGAGGLRPLAASSIAELADRPDELVRQAQLRAMSI